MRNNNHLKFPVKKKVNKRKPNVATLKRLQMRRWSKVIEKRVEAENNKINKDKTIETFNVQMNLEKLLENRKIIGIDYVEYSPIENFHAYDYISANIIYDLMKLCLK